MQYAVEAERQAVLADQQRRLADYIFELRQVRRAKLDEERYERALYKAILNAWRLVKNLRVSQQYSCSSIKLLIKKCAPLVLFSSPLLSLTLTPHCPARRQPTARVHVVTGERHAPHAGRRPTRRRTTRSGRRRLRTT